MPRHKRCKGRVIATRIATQESPVGQIRFRVQVPQPANDMVDRLRVHEPDSASARVFYQNTAWRRRIGSEIPKNKGWLQPFFCAEVTNLLPCISMVRRSSAPRSTCPTRPSGAGSELSPSRYRSFSGPSLFLDRL